MKYKILIIESDKSQLNATDKYLRSVGYETVLAECGEEALDILSNNNKEGVNLIFMEMILDGMDGEETLFNIRSAYANMPVIMTTATNNYNLVIDLMNKGVDDFISKPISYSRLKVIIDNTIEKKVISEELGKIKKLSSKDISFTDLIEHSEEFKNSIMLAEKAAKSNIPVLLLGETGTGKDMLAKSIHNAGPRAEKPFMVVNCSALNKRTAELVLFGKGAGVITEDDGLVDAGKFVQANGGTIFLDEIWELPHEVQAKVLHAIERKEFEPIGSSRPVEIDVRVICSSSKDLAREVLEERLMADLLFRIDGLPIEIPSLKNRKEDIEPLVRLFMQKFSILEGKDALSISDDTIKALQDYDWPGNIRELENHVYKAVLLADNGSEAEIAAADLQRSKLLSSGFEPSIDAIKISKNDGTLKSMEELRGEILEKYSSYFDGKMSEAASYLETGMTAGQNKKAI